MPMLIYVVLQANPEHLVSNVQYILRFRNQDKLGVEAGYYLSSLVRCDTVRYLLNNHTDLCTVWSYPVYRDIRSHEFDC
jgi:hypothetical protein